MSRSQWPDSINSPSEIPGTIQPVSQTSFAAESLLERKDLQRLLRRDISPVGDDLLVIAEEYGEWEDSNRRIDLLCLSRDAGLAVVEIKRTQDGGHMELQAIRYAAMVSSMTLEQAIEAYARTKGGEPESARTDILDFLQVASDDEAELTGEVRIVLVSADFSTELTTAVLWLNRHDVDITCNQRVAFLTQFYDAHRPPPAAARIAANRSGGGGANAGAAAVRKATRSFGGSTAKNFMSRTSRADSALRKAGSVRLPAFAVLIAANMSGGGGGSSRAARSTVRLVVVHRQPEHVESVQ